MASSQSIVIIGAGIIGLDVALALSLQGFGPNITVIAEHMPDDRSTEYTSPWAGCNFSAISGSDDNALRWDKLGYAHLTKLASEQPSKSCVSRTPSKEYWDDEIVPRDKIQAMADYLEDFHIIPNSDLPEGVGFGISCTTVTVNAPRHLLYLRDRLRDEFGVTFTRRKLPNLPSAFSPSTRLVFNCTGNGAATLPGVADSNCYPTRGQVVLVRAPAVRTNVMRHGKDYETYVIPRPESDGNVILGGYMQKGNNDGSTYPHETESILQRTIELSHELRAAQPEVLDAFAGLRPSRHGGARVQRDDSLGNTRTVVHNYGAGGTGFQAGYGMATDAVALAQDVLSALPRGGPD